MASSKKRRRHAMAFGAFFGDGTGSGLSTRTNSNESLPSGPDSLDEDIEAGNDEDYDSADSLDNDDVALSNDEKAEESSSSSDSGSESEN